MPRLVNAAVAAFAALLASDLLGGGDRHVGRLGEGRVCFERELRPRMIVSGQPSRWSARQGYAGHMAIPPGDPLPIRGGCLCGGVRFEVIEQPIEASYCHCTRCQRRTGGGSSAQARVVPGSVRVLSGADLVRVWEPPDGFGKAFCSACGSALWSIAPGTDAPASIRLGAFDGDPGVPAVLPPVHRLCRCLGADSGRRPAAPSGATAELEAKSDGARSNSADRDSGRPAQGRCRRRRRQRPACLRAPAGCRSRLRRGACRDRHRRR